MNGYLDAISDQFVTIRLGGRDITYPRARLGLHLKLARIVNDFDQAPGWSEMAAAIRRYFEALELDISAAHPVEILAAFLALKRANSWQWALAFMLEPGQGGEKLSYDYPDRNWAWTVHKLASRYSWTQDYILSLYPEAAACYLQEILVSETHEAEERHSLSELAYRYNSTTRTSEYVPLPRPSWMVPQVEAKPVRIRRDFLPYGVFNLNDEPIEYH